MMMVLGRSYVLATTKGHAIRFIKGSPVYVPPNCVPDAVAIGAQAADGAEVDVIPQEVKTYEGPADPTVREKELLAAVQKIVDMNARKDFTAAGLPSTDAMTRVAGFDVGAAERNAAWQVYCNMKAAPSDE